MDYIIRDMHPTEYPLLADFITEAIYFGGKPLTDELRAQVLADPLYAASFEGFGTLPDDRSLVVEVDGRVAGCCWARTVEEYGHIDEETPSLSIALFEEYRGRGLGTALMSRMLDELAAAGYKRCSLSVDKNNPARHLYERLGFVILGDGVDDTEWLMARELQR